MDNLTHSLVGLAAAKAGLERTSPYSTVVCVIAANAPDADVLTLFIGPWVYLEHHRGISHSVIGTLFIALTLPVLFYVGDQLIARVRRKQSRARFRGLLVSSLIMSASHPLLDWTNSYGVRPLLPWRAQWFYGDLVFILDPWLWLSVGGAAFLLTARTGRRAAAWAILAFVITAVILFLPRRAGQAYPLASRALWLAGLAGLVVLHRTRIARRWGASVAVVALALIVVYWGALAAIHARALMRAHAIAAQIVEQSGEKLIRVAATPMLADPLTWLCLAETDRAVHRFSLSLGSDGLSPRNAARFEKPEGENARLVERAARDGRAAVFLDFARFPATRIQRDCASETLVQFADLRYTEPGSGQQRGGFALDVPVERTP